MQNLNDFLEANQNKDLCRFITCGSVDDGKSTLIGRLLYDSKALFDDQLNALEKDSKRLGTQSGELDFALLVDGLSTEREQGITIDVAYRFFSTETRKYIIADTPGHEQYTRNMATGASTADIAVILLDARKGVLTQSKRHSYIVSLLGIRHIIVAVNKMDLINYSQDAFDKIVSDYKQIIPHLAHNKFISFDFIPISALNGENILHKCQNLAWYKGKSLMEILDSAPLHKQESGDFIMPVQFVNRPNLDYRAFCGSIQSGGIKVGDEICILPQNKHSKIKAIVSQNISDLNCKNFDKNALYATKEAYFPQSVSLILDDEIDITRGDIIASKNHNLKLGKSVIADIVWFDEIPLELQYNYVIKRATTLLKGDIESIIYKKDINDFSQNEASHLHLNDIARCVVKFDRIISFDSYENNKSLGSFIIIDKYSNATLGAGMIVDSTKESDLHKAESKRIYTPQERALNKFIRENFPEWHCKEI